MKKNTVLFCFIFCFGLSSCARFFPKGPDRYYFGAYSEAETAYNQERYQEAIDKYSAYTAENPEGNLAVIAKYYTARSYAQLGQMDKARELYQEIVQKYPDLVWAKFSASQLEELKAGKKPA